MKMRKYVAIIGSGLFFFLIVSMYLVLEQFSRGNDRDIFEKAKIAQESVRQLSKDVDGVVSQLENSQKAIQLMKDKVENLQGGKTHAKSAVAVRDDAMCAFSDAPSGHSADVKMLDVFDLIPFDNPDGGAWKQGWDVQFPANAFDKEQLLVFVVPHSHNDPGWIKTVDQYYRDQTRHILDNVVDALSQNPNRKFIWAETSYFSMWWEEADDKRKQLARRLLSKGQLEIVTGGWVMNDEAATHYYAMIDQLLEGHQWMNIHMGVKPKVGWAIDPFGHTSTMAYLLKRSGFNAMLIQRVHYSVKKYLASNKQLEFMWRQNWDHDSTTDILCHMMPFYSYDVPHTCGPDPKICCQFDFRRLPGGGIACPWMVPPIEITEDNVKERSYTLLDQYRKKAQLYQTNIVLAPLGDDFRYEIPFEANVQYTNYEKIIEYVNSNPDLKAKIQFGTLSDYFNAIWKRKGVEVAEKPPGFPVLGGDFFTYADRDDHYWSGYFTSRSFYKHLDRVLESYHRSSEILFTLAHVYARKAQTTSFPAKHLFKKLAEVRQDLGLFQHHDGITGTARDHVVVDYGVRMEKSIKKCQDVIGTSAQFLLSKDQKAKSVDYHFKFGESQSTHDSLFLKELVIISSEPRKVVFYNSLTHARQQVVSLHISEPKVKVIDSSGREVASQVSLLWTREQQAMGNKFELTFRVSVNPLGLSSYFISRAQSKENLAQVGVLGTDKVPAVKADFEIYKRENVDIVLKNKFLQATFDPAVGTLLEVVDRSSKMATDLKLTFHVYGTRSGMDKSGAYLFLPDGEAKEIGMHSATLIVVEGNVYSEVITQIQYLTHSVRIYHEDVPEAQALQIRNLVDIRNAYNVELIMRVTSGVKNIDREFFTDLNGFQMQRRRTLKKLPLQANFYPLGAIAFLQDQKQRLSIHSKQSNGIASLQKGEFEVVLDRRMFQDDNRGLGQGITDNKITPSDFQILLETFTSEGQAQKKTSPTAYPSLLSMHLLGRFQHPLYPLIASLESKKPVIMNTFTGMGNPLPCDMHLLTLRTLQKNITPTPSEDAALIIHRMAYDCRFKFVCPVTSAETSFQNIFSPLEGKRITETTLTLIEEKGSVDAKKQIVISPMEIKTYKISLE